MRRFIGFLVVSFLLLGCAKTSPQIKRHPAYAKMVSKNQAQICAALAPGTINFSPDERSNEIKDLYQYGNNRDFLIEMERSFLELAKNSFQISVNWVEMDSSWLEDVFFLDPNTFISVLWPSQLLSQNTGGQCTEVLLFHNIILGENLDIKEFFSNSTSRVNPKKSGNINQFISYSIWSHIYSQWLEGGIVSVEISKNNPVYSLDSAFEKLLSRYKDLRK